MSNHQKDRDKSTDNKSFKIYQKFSEGRNCIYCAPGENENAERGWKKRRKGRKPKYKDKR